MALTKVSSTVLAPINNVPIGDTTPSTGSFTTINSTGDMSVGGNLSVTGNLTINGTSTTVNSNTVTVDDPIITLGGDTAPLSADSKDRGVEFRWHNGTTAKVGFFGFDVSSGKFIFIPDATNTSEVFSGTSGSIVANVEGTVTGNATTATTLQTARTIAISGDGVGTATSFNGSANISIPFTLGTTGVPAGTYKSVTVDTKGRVTAGTNPTTLAEYGITDAQPLDADLTALAGLNTYGLVALTAAGTAASRTISVSGAGLSITNGGGLAGNPTITSNATSSNTASTLVARDASGNFSAGNITATSFNGGAAFTGTPTAPTAGVNTNTTQLATTAFVYNNRPISGTLTVSTAGTQFTLPSAIKVPLIIAIDGVLQEPTNSFTVSAGVITFTESVPVGSVIFALGYTG